MSEIKAVLFDVGGVLHRNNIAAVKADLITELGIDRPTLDGIWKAQIPLLGSGKIDEVEFWRQLSRDYGVRAVDASEDLLARAFCETLQPQRETIALAHELGRQGVRVAILSNTIAPHARVSRHAGLYEGFDPVLLSHEIGLRKPDPSVFRYALHVLRLKPQQVVMVDDGLENVNAARTVGMEGIVCDNPEQLAAELNRLISA